MAKVSEKPVTFTLDGLKEGSKLELYLSKTDKELVKQPAIRDNDTNDADKTDGVIKANLQLGADYIARVTDQSDVAGKPADKYLDVKVNADGTISQVDITSTLATTESGGATKIEAADDKFEKAAQQTFDEAIAVLYELHEDHAKVDSTGKVLVLDKESLSLALSDARVGGSDAADIVKKLDYLDSVRNMPDGGREWATRLQGSKLGGTTYRVSPAISGFEKTVRDIATAEGVPLNKPVLLNTFTPPISMKQKENAANILDEALSIAKDFDQKCEDQADAIWAQLQKIETKSEVYRNVRATIMSLSSDVSNVNDINSDAVLQGLRQVNDLANDITDLVKLIKGYPGNLDDLNQRVLAKHPDKILSSADGNPGINSILDYVKDYQSSLLDFGTQTNKMATKGLLKSIDLKKKEDEQKKIGEIIQIASAVVGAVAGLGSFISAGALFQTAVNSVPRANQQLNRLKSELDDVADRVNRGVIPDSVGRTLINNASKDVRAAKSALLDAKKARTASGWFLAPDPINFAMSVTRVKFGTEEFATRGDVNNYIETAKSQRAALLKEVYVDPTGRVPAEVVMQLKELTDLIGTLFSVGRTDEAHYQLSRRGFILRAYGLTESDLPAIGALKSIPMDVKVQLDVLDEKISSRDTLEQAVDEAQATEKTLTDVSKDIGQKLQKSADAYNKSYDDFFGVSAKTGKPERRKMGSVYERKESGKEMQVNKDGYLDGNNGRFDKDRQMFLMSSVTDHPQDIDPDAYFGFTERRVNTSFDSSEEDYVERMYWPKPVETTPAENVASRALEITH